MARPRVRRMPVPMAALAKDRRTVGPARALPMAARTVVLRV